MAGSSYQTEDHIVFVLPWSQNGALVFNTVTLPFGPVPTRTKYIPREDPLEGIPVPPVVAGPDRRAASLPTPQPGAIGPNSRR